MNINSNFSVRLYMKFIALFLIFTLGFRIDCKDWMQLGKSCLKYVVVEHKDHCKQKADTAKDCKCEKQQENFSNETKNPNIQPDIVYRHTFQQVTPFLNKSSFQFTFYTLPIQDLLRIRTIRLII